MRIKKRDLRVGFGLNLSGMAGSLRPSVREVNDPDFN